jgi:GTP cyclohydrolase I
MIHEDSIIPPLEEGEEPGIYKPGNYLYGSGDIDRPALVADGVRKILRAMGVDMADRNFASTPERYAKFIEDMFWGQPPTITTFPEDHDQMVILRSHECWTLCPHHLLPVRFEMAAAYIPSGNVLGVSKLARLFDEINTVPLMQETATDLLCERLHELTGGMGAGVVMRGEHLCMKMRGIRSPADIVTSKLMGVLANNPQARNEFLQFVAHPLTR